MTGGGADDTTNKQEIHFWCDMRRLAIILILMMGLPCWSLTQVVRYVDPDAGGGGTGVDWTNAYTSLWAWNTTENKDLVSADEYHTVHLRASGGTADTTVTILTSTWVTDATRYLEIIQDDAPSDGKWSDTAYRLYCQGSVKCIEVATENLYIRDMQLRCAPASSFQTSYGIFLTVNSNGNVEIDSCLIRCSGALTLVSEYGIALWNATNQAKVYNCTIYSDSANTTTSHGIYVNSASSLAVYNSTVYGFYSSGIRDAGSVTTATNCVVATNGDDFANGTTASYCASDDGDGGNAQDAVSGDWDNELTDANNGDFTLVAEGNCIGNGTDNPGSGLYLDDITGATRTTTWDIGAFEYGAGGGTDYASLWWWRRRHNN